MTQVQRIIASALSRSDIKSGMRVYIKEPHPAISKDALCGAYGRLFLKEKAFTVPEGVFINLDGALKNDAKTEEIAQHICNFLKDKKLFGLSVEFGGDSMGYLTMEDRAFIVKTISESEIAPFCVIFECDYITAEYTMDTLKEKTVAFYNDGPQSFREIIALDLGEI